MQDEDEDEYWTIAGRKKTSGGRPQMYSLMRVFQSRKIVRRTIRTLPYQLPEFIWRTTAKHYAIGRGRETESLFLEKPVWQHECVAVAGLVRRRALLPSVYSGKWPRQSQTRCRSWRPRPRSCARAMLKRRARAESLRRVSEPSTHGF